MTERLLVRVEEAGQMIDVKRSKIWQLIHDGTIPSIRIGRSVRVPVESLRRWVEEQTSSQNEN